MKVTGVNPTKHTYWQRLAAVRVWKDNIMKLGTYTCTDEEAQTILHYGFRPEEIRVAHPRQYATTYHYQMKAAGQLVSVNAKPCPYGHTVRTRRGQCVMCS